MGIKDNREDISLKRSHALVPKPTTENPHIYAPPFAICWATVIVTVTVIVIVTVTVTVTVTGNW